ncbi:hypothetical protein AK830_g939 [Neonectria ditissima]|uniref:DUF7053 domain-containing protein n=1 Tax=Neonectria ditissima TaxID=78410 RepID=A0A0P7BG28_9HYPO|nr:hypothetical protein AK830_g939 [Neonectria ditissima]
MRSQHRTVVSIPIPGTLPPHIVVAFLQTYAPTLRHNEHVVGFDDIPCDPSITASDPFFGPWDASVRSFQVHEVTQLIPGVNRSVKWPVVFQCIPDGICSRADHYIGTIVWARWTVRRRDAGSPTHSDSTTSSSSTEPGDEWELFEEVLTDANTMMMPFTARVIDKVHNQISQRVVDEAFKAYMNGTLYQ